MELRCDLSVGDFGCFSLLVLIQVLLMSCLFQSSSRNVVAHLLVPHLRLSVIAELLAFADFEAVHFRFQGKEIGHWIALCYVFNKSNSAFVWIIQCFEAALVICWDFAKIEQAS